MAEELNINRDLARAKLAQAAAEIRSLTSGAGTVEERRQALEHIVSEEGKILLGDPLAGIAGADHDSTEYNNALIRREAALQELEKLGGFRSPVSGTARPQSKSEYDSLPSGASYIDPEGVTRIKP